MSPHGTAGAWLARLMLALALALLPVAGHQAMLAGGVTSALPTAPVQVAAGGGEDHHAHHMAGHDAASQGIAQSMAQDMAAAGEPSPAPHASHKLCCTVSCPACLWQEVAGPFLAVSAGHGVSTPPARTPIPPGQTPAPALDPPRDSA